MSKAQRQHRISSLLEEHAVTSQGQLTDLLEDGLDLGHAASLTSAVGDCPADEVGATVLSR